jgi:hypothetical protein
MAVGLTTKASGAIVKTAMNITALGGDSKRSLPSFQESSRFSLLRRSVYKSANTGEMKQKSYRQIYVVAIWFALGGYLPRDLDLLQHIINEIAGRERISPEQAKHKLLMAFISYTILDGLIRHIDWLNERVSVLNDEHNKLKDSLIRYRYFADVMFALFIEIGFTKTKDVVDAMRKILVSQYYYRCNPQALVLDLEEVRERRRKDEQQLPRQQQQNKEHDEVAKLKSEDDGSKSPSVAAAPALPERIQKPEGDSSPDDQCRKEEGGGAAGAGGTTRTRLLLPLTHRSRSMITKKMTEARVQRN